MKVSSRHTPPTLEGLDEVDRKIIKYLGKNGRESFTKIGDEIGVPASTVRDRTNRLVEHGVLQILGVLNPLKAQKRVMANIGVKLCGGNHRAIAEEISKFDEVTYLVICAGRFDLLVEVVCKDNAHMVDILSQLQNISNVQHTEAFTYFSIVKEVFDMEALDI